MSAAFAEAVRATTQPCTLLLLAPVVAVVAATRCRWSSLVAAVGGAVLGGVVFAANWIVLGDAAIRVTAVAVIAALALAVAAPRAGGPAWAADARAWSFAAGAVAFVATLWWRPCVGTELGVILTGARRDLAGELPGMTAYMLGAMVPVVLLVLLAQTLDLRGRSAIVAAWSGAAVGVAVAGALAAGRHDDLVATLTRLTTG